MCIIPKLIHSSPLQTKSVSCPIIEILLNKQTEGRSTKILIKIKSDKLMFTLCFFVLVQKSNKIKTL